MSIIIPKIDVNATAKKASISAIYGVGIGREVAVSKLKPRYNDVVHYQPDINTTTPDEAPDGRTASSLLGMPVMCYLKFVGDTYTSLQGDEITIPDIIFETVLITLSMGRNISKSDVFGRDSGTIKEWIGLGDWRIEIRAVITADAPVTDSVLRKSQSGVYPRDNMFEILKVLKAPLSIPIECWYLNQFDINYIVIDDGVEINQIEGEYSMQRLVIPCLSDNPLIIKIA